MKLLPNNKPKTLPIVLLILLLGMGLRIPGMSWGLPYQLEPDEPALFINAWELWDTGSMRLMSEYPPLYLYILAAQRAFIYHIFGAETPQVVYFFFARWNSILISLFILAFGYLLGKRLAGWRAGVALALFLAVEPLAARDLGWIIKVDNFAWLLSLLTLWAAYLAMQGASWRWWLVAVVAGIASTATKYNMVFVLLAPTYVLCYRVVGRRAVLAAVLLNVGVMGSVILSRQVIEHYWVDTIAPAVNHCSGHSTEFMLENGYDISKIRSEIPCAPVIFFQTYLSAFYQGEHINRQTFYNANGYIQGILKLEFGAWRLYIGAGLLLFSLLRHPTSRPPMLLLASVFSVSFFAFSLVASDFPPRQYYVLFLCIGGLLALGLAALGRWNRLAYWGLLLLLFVPYIPATMRHHAALHQPDTRVITAEFMLQNARQGEAVVVEYDRVEFAQQYGGFPRPEGYFNLPRVVGVYELDAPNLFEQGIYYVVADQRASYVDTALWNNPVPEAYHLILDLSSDAYFGPQRRIYRTFTPQHILDARFGDVALLHGYDLALVDATLRLKLYWHAQQSALPAYTLFVHCIDPSSGIARAQQDRPPKRPTPQWEQYEWVFDERTMTLPPGRCEIQIGLYDAHSGERLPINGNPLGVLPLQRVEIEG